MSLTIFIALLFAAIAVWVALNRSKKASNAENGEIIEHSNSSHITSSPQYLTGTDNLRAKLKSQLEQILEEHNTFVRGLVIKHYAVLSKKIRRHLRIDEYGKEIGYDEAGEEVSHFLSHVVKTEPGYMEMRQRIVDRNIDLAMLGRNRDEYHLDRLAIDEGAKLDEALVPWIFILATPEDGRHDLLAEAEIDLLSGAEYEIYCEDRLKQLGWSVHRKGGVGDQGVDLIARRNNTVVAIQCKRYAIPIGNHAIQQVEAGRQFEEAHYAAVISNSGYTRSAQQLASKLNVLLLHHSELEILHDHLNDN